MLWVAFRRAGGEGFRSGFVTSRPKSPQGCLYRHAKTGGYYWQVAARWAPVEMRAGKKILALPMAFGPSGFATKSKKHAEAVRRRLWVEWGRRTQTATGDVGVDKHLSAFEVWNTNKGTGGRQVAFNVAVATKFLDFSGRPEPWEISPSAVDRYLAAVRDGSVDGGDKRTARTVKAHAIAIGMFCKFLIRHGAMDLNPVDGIDLARAVKRPPQFLTTREIEALLERARLGEIDGKAVPPWLHDAIAVGVYEGPRMAKIRALRWQDVYDDHLLIGGGSPTKTGDYRTVPIFPEMRPVLEAMREAAGGAGEGLSGFIFPQHNTRWWLEQFERVVAVFPAFGRREKWKLLRSTFACQRAGGVGLDRPASPWELAAWLGHASVATTMRYVNLARAAGLSGLKG